MHTRSFPLSILLVLVLGCAASGGDALPDPRCTGKCDTADDGQRADTFEYVVIGAGAGGGTVASSLARMGHSVLLVEAGPFEPSERDVSAIPALHPQASEDPAISWQYFVEHYGDESRAALDSKQVVGEDGEARGIFYPRGSTLGGSTAVNAMIAVYPHESDWEDIAALTGDPSFHAWQMRQHFTNIEDNAYIGIFGREGHGFEGWLSVEQPDSALALRDLKLLDLVKAAASTAGDGLFSSSTQLLGLMRRDLNAYGAERDAAEGIFTIPTSTSGGRRTGVRARILDTVAEGHPLTIWTESLVTRVLFEEESIAAGRPRATGVEILEGAHLYRADRAAGEADEPIARVAHATREVIVSAGAFNTPQVLMLSGIGPRAELEEHGIETLVDLPGVGRNLQDRYEVPIVVRADSPFSLVEQCAFDVNVQDQCYADWTRGRGVYASNGGVVGMVRRAETALTADPDLFIFGLPGAFRGYFPGYSREVVADPTLFTWLVLKAHNANRGSVELRSADPRDTPLINFQYFGDPAAGVAPSGEHRADLDSVIEGLETVRELIAEANDSTLIAEYEEIWPGPDVDTREELGDFAMNESWGHHASCTAAIGADGDPMAVLDSHFRVRGVDGLRVVDASVFPRIPGFFPVVAVMMLGEKAAEDIHADAR
jgi:choline dehydrogenase